MPHTDTIVNGEQWPSVTECISILNKPFLARWRGKIGNEEADKISKQSANVGKEVHDAIEKFLKGGTVMLCGADDKVKPLFESWFQWWRDGAYECVSQEIKVISAKHKYGGTFDAILKHHDGHPILVDWKISNNDDRFRWLQLAGYAQAYFEVMNIKIKHGMIVRIDKQGKIHIKEVKNLWKYVPLFINCRKLWDFVNQKGKFKK